MSALGACRLFRLLKRSGNYPNLFNVQDRQIKRWVAPTLLELKKRQTEIPRYLVPKKVYPRNTFLEWNLNSELYAFKKRLNEEFKDDLLLQAFTHKTYLIQEEMKQRAVGIENPDIRLSHNEELIDEAEVFMRDYINAYLTIVLPRFPAEGVASITQHLTSIETLGHIGSNLGCKDIILADEYPVTVPTLAKTFSAIVGALIRSSGEERASIFVRDFVITLLNGKDVNDYWTIDDPIQMLSDILKREGKGNVAEYRLISQSAVNTILASYHVGLFIDKQIFTSGFGESVAIAKEMTAREALKVVFGTQENMPPLNFKLEGVVKESAKAQYISNSHS